MNRPSGDRREFLTWIGRLGAVAVLAPAFRPAGRPGSGACDLAANLDRWRDARAVPGVSALSFDGGRREFAGGYGVSALNDGRPVTGETVFRGASLTKPVFACGVMRLWEEGLLELDRPLVAFMENPFQPYDIPLPFRQGGQLMSSPDLPDDPRLARITPRMVLSHSTGLPNWGFGRPLRFLFDPGTGFGYSGEGYNYLQRVVEHVTGKPLDEFLHETFLAPLGMSGSAYQWRADYDRVDVAVGHNRAGNAVQLPRPRRALAAGSFYTTAVDYGEFLRRFADAAVGVAGGFPIAADTVRRMIEPQVEVAPGVAWGLGVGLETRDRGVTVWQWGDDGVFKHLAMASVRDRRGFVALTNSMNGLTLCRDVAQCVLPGAHPALGLALLQY